MNFLVNPDRVTKYNESQAKLELKILFWVCAAGKGSGAASRSLNKLLEKWKHLGKTPFQIVKNIPNLAQEMKEAGIGCYTSKSVTFLQLAHINFSLKTCTVQNLEDIKGIGPKTARCFLIHSRPNQRFAGLDTHILKFLRSKGIDAPKTTPSGKTYLKLEQEFIKLADEAGKSVADFDLDIWIANKKGS